MAIIRGFYPRSPGSIRGMEIVADIAVVKG